MHMFFRTVFHMFRGRWSSPLDIHDIGRMNLRVMPTDLDVLNHVNNGVYLSLMDLGRMDLLVRSGAWKNFTKRGFYPVVASETITFRKSLQPWQKYVLETRVVGYDVKAVFIEQRFVVDGEVYARAHISSRFLKKTGGVVTTSELSAAIGADISSFHPEPWISDWATTVALPSTRAEAPSDW
ncbi:MAG: acyl-CoA thioesterase [Microbacteriaceae bacterium]